ncbi:MAG: Vacuolar H+transporting two-sector ATPase F subunit [Desulfuromonadales bacterium]|nr:Vacuolar H+transporting two-sector ATPase F subunit [Desulfuromonadales bacterium]NIS41001.1 Vacuolar H+transporting two-sector ATPase F subunit [Desulfuromonadales bacterium]
MDIFVLGSEEVVVAFAMGGMAGRTVSDRREARDALNVDFAAEEIRLLVIEEQVAEMARDRVEALKLDPKAPLIVEVPGLSGPLEERRTPLEMVRRALGIEL